MKARDFGFALVPATLIALTAYLHSHPVAVILLLVLTMLGVSAISYDVGQSRGLRAGKAQDPSPDLSEADLQGDVVASDRWYSLMSSDWSHQQSDSDDEAWAATLVARRIVRSLSPNLEMLEMRFTQDDAFGLDPDNPPEYSLTRWERSSGRVVLSPPHLNSIDRFAFNIMFYPPLAKDEIADVEFRITFARSKFAYRDDILAASLRSDGVPRDYDFRSRTVDFPIGRAVLSAFFPDELGADFLGLEVTRRRNPFEQEVLAIHDQGCFTVARAVREGVPGMVLTLDRANPPIKARYRIRWRPPARTPTQTDAELRDV